MKKMLIELVAHLRERRSDIVQTQKIHYGEPDQTYGVPTIAEFEVIDFDSLVLAIDVFAREFKCRE